MSEVQLSLNKITFISNTTSSQSQSWSYHFPTHLEKRKVLRKIVLEKVQAMRTGCKNFKNIPVMEKLHEETVVFSYPPHYQEVRLNE